MAFFCSMSHQLPFSTRKRRAVFSAWPPERLNLSPLSRGIDWARLATLFPPSRGYTWSRPHGSQLRRGNDIAQKRIEVRLNRLNCVFINSKPEKTNNSLLTHLPWPVPQSGCTWAMSDRVSSRWASPRRAVFLALLRVPYRGQGVCFGPFWRCPCITCRNFHVCLSS